MAKIDDILARIDAQAARAQASRPMQAGRPPVPFLGPRLSAGMPRAAAAQPQPVPDAGTVFRPSDHDSVDDETFVRRAYLHVLGRSGDDASIADLVGRLATGALTRAELVLSLSRSPEGVARGTPVAGTITGRIASLGRRLPLVGKAVRAAARWGRSVRAVKHIDARFERVWDAIADARVELESARARDEAIVVAADDALLATMRRLGDAEAALDRTEAAMHDLRGRAAAIDMARTSLEEQARAVRMLVAEAARSGDLARATESEPFDTLRARAFDDLYLAFENRFRGAPEIIAERQARYLPLIRSLSPVIEGLPVLDVGCGRGEWLGLLTKAGIACRGIDLNAAMVETARGAGHEAIAGDAIAYLEGLPAGSLAAISAFHVVEHLPFERLVAFLDACATALAPGGAVLFETPNPENLVVGACTFHLDPTHVKPLPPGLLGFLVDARGFEAVRIIRADEDCDPARTPVGFAPTGVDDWFRVAPDYAVFGLRAFVGGA